MDWPEFRRQLRVIIGCGEKGDYGEQAVHGWVHGRGGQAGDPKGLRDCGGCQVAWGPLQTGLCFTGRSSSFEKKRIGLADHLGVVSQKGAATKWPRHV